MTFPVRQPSTSALPSMTNNIVPFSRDFQHRPEARHWLTDLGYYQMGFPIDQSHVPEVWEHIETPGAMALIEDFGDRFTVSFCSEEP